MSILYKAPRLLAFVPLALMGRSQMLDDGTTVVNGYWEDDYRGTPYRGWKVQNKRMEDGDHKYSPVNTTDLVVEIEGQKYHGLFKQDLAGGVGPDNYFTRWFRCKSPAATVIVEYYTGSCGHRTDDEKYQGINHELTQLSVEWNENKTVKTDPRDPQGSYRKFLGPPKGGFNPYSGKAENGYLLEDKELQFSCYPSDDTKSYWTQRHGVKAIPKPNDEGKHIAPAMEPFRIQIEVETGLDGNGLHHFLVLYNISVKCFDTSQLKEHYKKQGKDGKAKVLKRNQIKKLFRALGGVVAVIVVLALGGYGIGTCMKKRKLRLESASTNGALREQMSPQMAVANVNGDGRTGYDMRPIHIQVPPDSAHESNSDINIR